MADEEESEELVMIAEKARTLLNRSERQVLSRCCSSYLSGQMSVRYFVDALLRLLPTPDKATFLVELRELVRDEDHDEYDYRVFAVRRPFRTVQFQSSNSLDYEQSTECLLQVERHPLYQDYELLENDSANCSPIIRESSRAAKSLKVRGLDLSNDVDAIQQLQPPPLPQASQPFRGLKETNIPMMTLDMTTAFPAIASAFRPAAAAAATSTASPKEAFSGSSLHRGPTQQQPQPEPTQQQQPQHRPSAAVKTARTGRRTGDEPMEVVIRKTKTILGMAIEGGVDTRHPLPRIITIDGKGTAFEAAGLRIGQTILQVDGKKMEGLTHEEAARLIANAYADRSVPELKLLMSPSTFRPNANYQPEN